MDSEFYMQEQSESSHWIWVCKWWPTNQIWLLYVFINKSLLDTFTSVLFHCLWLLSGHEGKCGTHCKYYMYIWLLCNIYVYMTFLIKSVPNFISDCSLIIDCSKTDSITNLGKDAIIWKITIILKIYEMC